MARAFRGLSLAAAQAAADKKGEGISLLHVSRLSPLADYLLIVTALSRPHMEAIEDSIESAAAGLRARCLHRSRPRSDRWRVLDYGGLLVHIMTAQTRDFYALDKLYGEAAAVRWQAEESAPVLARRRAHARTR